MDYKLSKFNLVIKDSEQENILYNTYRKVPVKLKADNSSCRLNEDMIENLSNETIEKLLKVGLIVSKYECETDVINYECNKLQYTDRRLELTILPTDGCNFDCIYCYQSEPYHVICEEVKENLYKYLENNLKYFEYLVIDWFGGEPLLVKEIVVEMTEKILEICKRNKVAFVGRMTTNGSRIDLNTFQTLIKCHILYYQITIDGTEMIHNKQRPLKNGQNSYQIIINNLMAIRDQVKSRLFNILIRINVTKTILDNMDEFLEFYKKEFYYDSRFILSWEPVQDWGGEKIENTKSDMISDFDYYFSAMDHAMKEKFNFSVGYSRNKDEWMCIACKKNGFVLNHNGDVLKCTMGIYDDDEIVRDMNKIGVLDKYGNMNLDEKKISVWMRDNRTASCKVCKYYPLCGGLECPYAVNFKDVDNCYKINYFKQLIDREVKVQFKKNGEVINV